MAELRFERRFVVQAPLAAVRAFHDAPEALRQLTPTALRMDAPAPPVRDGELVRFTLFVGVVPVRWVARYENVREDGFDDVQVSGPFRGWRHEHRYRALPDGATEVLDRITAQPGGALSRAIWLGLAPAFAYRAWRTRRALEP